MFQKWFELGEKAYSESDAEWDAYVASHPQGSLLQTTNWARLKNRFNWSSQRVWLRRDGRIVAGAQILFRPAALGLVKIGYIPHGPLVDWDDEEQVELLFNQIDLAAYRHRAGIVKIEPMLWQDDAAARAWESICLSGGQKMLPADTIQPPRTMLVDLRPSLDQILAAMKPKTRYNIHLSARKGVTVRQASIADIGTFLRLMAETGARDKFGFHAPEYYKAAVEIFVPEMAALHLAEYQGKPLAAAMVFACGDRAAYLYGASSNEERNRMPNHAAQWAAMQWARERGCLSYDLWGIPDAPPDELEADFLKRTDGLWGVYRFKRGFGGEIKRTVGSIDRIYNKRVHTLYQRWRSRRAR
jgi:lipid II:glycine glycyltransferase (peptidoglycan interpeptide bridge formation enzyme)